MQTLEERLTYQCARLMARLRSGSVNQGIESLTRSLLETLLSTDLIQRKPDFHPLGFVDLGIIQYANGDSLSLHIWPPRVLANSELSIHNHFFESTSYVLLGEVRNTNFKVIERQFNSSHVLYKVVYDRKLDKRFLKRTQINMEMDVISSSIIQKGEMYAVPKGVYHEIDIGPQLPVATLFAKTCVELDRPFSYVIGKYDNEENYAYPTMYCEPEFVRQLITDVISSDIM